MFSYVFDDNNYLVERLRLESPLPYVSISIKKDIDYSFKENISPCYQPSFVKEDYKALFRSLDNQVYIYSNSKAQDFIERALRNTPFFMKEEFLFKPYRTQAQLLDSKKETIEKFVLEAIKLAKNESNYKAYEIITEMIAKKIEIVLANGI